MAEKTDSLFIDPSLLHQAERHCRQRLQNDPQNRTILKSLAEVYRKLGSLDESAAIYAQIAESHHEDQEADYLRAVLQGANLPTAPSGMRASPFALLKDFLSQEFHDSLMPFLISVRERFVPALVSDKKGKGIYLPDYRDTLDFTGEWESKERFMEQFKKILPDMKSRLQVDPFPIESIDVHVRAYQDGHFFKVHNDTGKSGSIFSNRVLSFVYFFHRIPRPYSGGELLLFDSDIETGAFTKSRFTQITPIDNALVVFPSNFHHCVVPICCPSRNFADSRFVINGFLHKRLEADRDKRC